MHIVITVGLGALLTAAVVIWIIFSITIGRRRRRKERERLARLRTQQQTKLLRKLERELAPPRSRFRFWRR